MSSLIAMLEQLAVEFDIIVEDCTELLAEMVQHNAEMAALRQGAPAATINLIGM